LAHDERRLVAVEALGYLRLGSALCGQHLDLLRASTSSRPVTAPRQGRQMNFIL
jgi:hypothetical protein